MKDASSNYLAIGNALNGAEESQLFGKPCFKINGKAFICFFQDCMVFKLQGDEHKKALALKGTVLFDPSRKKRPMKEWVQVPATHEKEWPKLAKVALAYVNDSK